MQQSGSSGEHLAAVTIALAACRTRDSLTPRCKAGSYLRREATAGGSNRTNDGTCRTINWNRAQRRIIDCAGAAHHDWHAPINRKPSKGETPRKQLCSALEAPPRTHRPQLPFMVWSCLHAGYSTRCLRHVQQLYTQKLNTVVQHKWNTTAAAVIHGRLGEERQPQAVQGLVQHFSNSSGSESWQGVAQPRSAMPSWLGEVVGAAPSAFGGH